MPIARDIRMLTVLVNVRYLNYCLKVLVSLLLYTENRRVPSRGLLIGFRVLIPVYPYKDKDSEVYLDFGTRGRFKLPFASP